MILRLTYPNLFKIENFINFFLQLQIFEISKNLTTKNVLFFTYKLVNLRVQVFLISLLYSFINLIHRIK